MSLPAEHRTGRWGVGSVVRKYRQYLDLAAAKENQTGHSNVHYNNTNKPSHHFRHSIVHWAMNYSLRPVSCPSASWASNRLLSLQIICHLSAANLQLPNCDTLWHRCQFSFFLFFFTSAWRSKGRGIGASWCWAMTAHSSTLRKSAPNI